MTPAESAERERLVAAVTRARQASAECYDEYVEVKRRWNEAEEQHYSALLALAAFDAAHKGEG